MADSMPGYKNYLTDMFHCQFQLWPLMEEEVSTIMPKQQPKLSCGQDMINNKLVKHCHKELAQPMTIIINKSIEPSKVPKQHKLARMIPLYKNGAANEFGNYRPVSLLPALSKILEKAVCQQLMAYLKKYNLLCSQQYGFRSKNQTSHVVHSMLNSVAENMTEGSCTIASFIDLNKAFDCLQYKKLFTKM